MTKKIFRSTVAVGLAVLAASLVIIMGALYSYFGKLQEQQLKDELSIAAAAMAEGDGMSYLTRLDSNNYRITWLRADGLVLYDTRADAATMENHARREEVRQALANGAGESSRYSNTMLTKMLYYAQRLPDGTVLRSRGECEGEIMHGPKGDGGFGYDPVFKPDAVERGMAELTPDEKNAISHRGKALRAFAEELKRYYNGNNK